MVTINISVKLLLSLVTLHKVKRLVSLLPGERVCFVVHKRQRTKGGDMGAWLWVFSFAAVSGCFTVVVPIAPANRKLVHFKILGGSTECEVVK